MAKSNKTTNSAEETPKGGRAKSKKASTVAKSLDTNATRAPRAMAPAKPRTRTTGKMAAPDIAVSSKTETQTAEIPAKKPGPAKNATRPRGKRSSPIEIAIDNNEIALRAYFIAERRMKEGIPGDHEQDWLQAEQEIRAELAALKRRKTTRPKKG